MKKEFSALSPQSRNSVIHILQMRLDRFAADLPVGQIGAVTFALSPSLRGANGRSNPAFFVAATKLDCFDSLSPWPLPLFERISFPVRSIRFLHPPVFPSLASGLPVP